MPTNNIAFVNEKSFDLKFDILKSIFDIQSENGKAEKELSQKMSFYRYENIVKPVIFIGAGTCGFVAGAAKTKLDVERFIKEWL